MELRGLFAISCSLCESVALRGQSVLQPAVGAVRLVNMYDFPVHAAKLRKNERNTKGKLSFLFISECQVSSAKPKLRKVESKTKEFFLFFFFLE